MSPFLWMRKETGSARQTVLRSLEKLGMDRIVIGVGNVFWVPERSSRQGVFHTYRRFFDWFIFRNL